MSSNKDREYSSSGINNAEQLPKLYFEDENVLIIAGKWLMCKELIEGQLIEETWEHLNIGIGMNNPVLLSFLEYSKILSEMKKAFAQMGFSGDDMIIIHNGDISKSSFDIRLQESSFKSSVVMSNGENDCSIITITSPDSTKVYYSMLDENGVSSLSLKYKSNRLTTENGCVCDFVSFAGMADAALLHGNGYNLVVDISYQKATWEYDESPVKRTREYFDRTALLSAVSGLSLPVDAVSFFETCSRFAIKGRDALAELSVRQSIVIDGEDGEKHEVETDYIEASNKRFKLTDGTSCVGIIGDSEWSYVSAASLSKNSEAIDSNADTSEVLSRVAMVKKIRRDLFRPR